jgi:hypothetical protein
MSLDKYLKEIDDERQQEHQYNLDKLSFWLESLNKSIQEVHNDAAEVRKYLLRLKEGSREIA